MARWTLSSLPPPKSATLTAPSQCPEPLIIAIIAIIVITVTMVMVMHYDLDTTKRMGPSLDQKYPQIF